MTDSSPAPQPPAAAPRPAATGWQALAPAAVRGFHTYANWLVGISWRRFALLAVLLLISAGILKNIPPFSWEWTPSSRLRPPTPAVLISPAPPPAPPAPPAEPALSEPPPQDASSPSPTTRPGVHIERPARDGKDGVQITIDERGVRIVPSRPATAAASAASAASGASPAPSPASAASQPLVDIRLPPGVTSEAVREAVADARLAIEDAVKSAEEEARAAREEAREEAQQARDEAATARSEARAARAAAKAARAEARDVHDEAAPVSLGDFLPSLAMLWIVASAIIKVTYKKQIQAEAQAAQAVETAEAESLRRQVLEARMAAMQAQVEPHFLFNTLASIDHLIEVDPPRASQMQKNLIALLRASMPTMREADGGTPRDLGRELAVIRPYLEILKVRMEERLATAIDVPEGLLSAEFPAMMVQTLVENAIKHGLEPKPEGGTLRVSAEIVHGKLQVTVADSGLGFGRAATAGTGVGLANIRERLQLLYGRQASLTLSENPGGGTRATISVPYKPLQAADAPVA